MIINNVIYSSRTLLFFTVLFSCCLVLRCSSLFAISDDQSRQALSELTSKVILKELSNGVKVLFYQRGTAEVFSGAVAVRVGGADESPGNTGISHMFEHMAFKGTKSAGTKDYLSEKPLLEELELLALKQVEQKGKLSKLDQQRWDVIHGELAKIWDVGDFMRQYAQRGAKDTNATTSKDFTTYMTSMPRSALEFWAASESERLLNPVMRQFYQERDVIMEERRMRSEDDPAGRLYEALLKNAYQVHPYRHPVIGYPEDINSLTASATEQFRQYYYVGRNIAVSIVGSVDVESDLALLEKTFGRIPAGSEIKRPQQVEPEQQQQRQFLLKSDSDPQIMLAYHKPNYPDSDDPPLTVMEEIIAGGKLSPLYRELVEKLKITPAVSNFEAPDNGYPNLMIFHSEIKAGHSNQEWLTHFDRIIDEFLLSAPSEQQMQIAKRAIAMSYLSRIRSNLSLAVDLAQAQLLYGSYKVSLEWYDQAMKVSAADVQRVARKYLKPSNRTIGLLEKR